MQAAGAEVWPLHTVTLSGHVGRPGWAGKRAEPHELSTLWGGLRAHGCLDRCQIVLAGYLGSVEVGRWLRNETDQLNQSTFICDPVMGDGGRLYVSEAIASFYKDNLGGIDALIPNHFELSYLSDVDVKTLSDAQYAANVLHQKGVEVVIAKGLHFPTKPDTLSVLISTPYVCVHITHPRRAPGWVGTGDAFSALLAAARAQGASWENAALFAAANLLSLIDKTVQSGRADGELNLPGFIPSPYTHQNLPAHITIESLN